MQIKIGKKIISKKSPCYIIAEAGVNHNGSFKLAKKLVDAACGAGADAVKFQTFKSENLVTDKADMAEYQKKNLSKSGAQFEMLKRLELPYSDFKKLKKYCDKKEITFLSTAHTEDAVDFLDLLMPAFKVGSGDLTNIPFLEKIAAKHKPIILSTGMATLGEIKEAVQTINKKKNYKIILLHCTTNYPCPLEEVNLKAMSTLKQKFSLATGYSDHTKGILVSLLSTMLGAVLLEKHFTLDKNLPGPDHKASLDPSELKEMVLKIRQAERALGDGVKKPNKSELSIKKNIRKSIVAKVDINKGVIVNKNMLAIKRPEGGLKPKYFNKIIGKKAKQKIKVGQLIKPNMI